MLRCIIINDEFKRRFRNKKEIRHEKNKENSIIFTGSCLDHWFYTITDTGCIKKIYEKNKCELGFEK